MPDCELIKMARGGARHNSGPPPNPESERSIKRGFSVTALPNEGYRGVAPDFPLMPPLVFNEYYDKEKGKVREKDADGTAIRADREAELWESVWETPQACAWSLEPWRWHSVAMWVRTAVICESPEATAADKGSLHRFADQIGLTPAGLTLNGWSIAVAEISPDEQDSSDEDGPAKKAAGGSRNRLPLAVVAGGK